MSLQHDGTPSTTRRCHEERGISFNGPQKSACLFSSLWNLKQFRFDSYLVSFPSKKIVFLVLVGKPTKNKFNH